MNKYISEMIGTMILVLTGCGSVVFAGNMPGTVSTGAGALEVAMAFGLSYKSGDHAGGGYCSGRMGGKDALLYMIFQVIGGILGSAVLFILVSTGSHADLTMAASNGFGEGEMLQAFIAETVFTFIFAPVALGATDKKKGAGKLTGLVIGLTLVLVHIVCISITGTSVNLAVAPLTGGLVGAIVWKVISHHSDKQL